MIPEQFEYHCPDTLSEAYDLLDRFEDEAKILSGGHSLIPTMKLRLAAPSAIVDLRRISGLGSIEEEEAGLKIGALVTHNEVETSSLVAERCALLQKTAAEIGDVQVRNVGTLVGSISHADPAADYPATMLALDAEVVIGSSSGERTILFSEFLQGLFVTVLAPNEIVNAVRIPAAHPSTASYVKMKQSASGFALAGVAAQLSLDGDTIVSAALGVTGVADCAYRATVAEDALRDLNVGDGEAVRAAVRGIAEGKDLLSDIHASSDYRAHLADVLAARAVLSSSGKA
jgi:carbon-monoxide dehydrogenase medium subunit